MTESDHAARRRGMVAEQLRARGIRDAQLLRAFETVPRHLFVPPELAANAYQDRPLAIGQGQTISQPYMVALMLERLLIETGAPYLDVGTGSGYQAALLAELGVRVWSVERITQLADTARANLARAGYSSVTVAEGDGSGGWIEQAPYMGIVVAAAAPHPPPALVEQLAIGGTLVVPVGDRNHQQLAVVTRRQSGVEDRREVECAFVPLIGSGGFAN
jgi:protein-L-isoaspartate(D-aspartate) O-methyltransferase